MRKFLKAVAVSVGSVMLALSGSAAYLSETLPDSYYVAPGEMLSINWAAGVGTRGLDDFVPASLLSKAGNSYRTELTLCKVIPIKTVEVSVVEQNMVIPGGTPFGIKMFTNGVMIVGMTDVDTGKRSVNPAKECGLRTGDVVLSIDGRSVSTNEEVAEIIAQSGGSPMRIDYTREGESLSATLIPVKSSYDGSYKAGMWVRDSTAGIGTLTYYDPSTHTFAGLGHAVCDVDTSEEMPLGAGEAVSISITGATKGVAGVPGELHGIFTGGEAFGRLTENSKTGIYGECDRSPIEAEPVKVASMGEIRTGSATILTTVEGTSPSAYDVEIEKINMDSSSSKNMVVRIVDEELLYKTGGIVQGMSGSPIIQDGKLVGAITHTFVNDPTRGYGIFIGNMLNSAS